MNYEDEVAALRRGVAKLREERDRARALVDNLLRQLARAERLRVEAERRAAVAEEDVRVGISMD